MSPSDAQKAAQRIGELFRTGARFSEPTEYKSRHVDGRDITVEISSVPMEYEGLPAVLAFAGLGPDDEAPSTRLPAATEDERDRLRTLAAGLEARLARLVEAEPIGLGELIARPAEVRFERGWIEVRFPLSAVDTRVRRAGLDLDPDFVPWLGCVVRFSYA